MKKDTMIGVDLAKSVFQIHGASMRGAVKFRKKLSRSQFHRFMASHAPAVVAMEACGSANYWARELSRLGHDVKLIPPRYVKPFVKRQKNDAADAEAIVEAAQRPEMRFVAPKSEDQQAKAMLYRVREKLVCQRTELMNALRSYLYEFGHTFPQGIAHLKQIEALVVDRDCNLPKLVCNECRDLIMQIYEISERIENKTRCIKELARETNTARRLQTMPGVGPITALAVEAFAPCMMSFKRGRDFAAWLGLVPRQHSSGGKERLGRVSKAGQADIRKLLILGAMSRLNWLGRKTIPDGTWLAKLSERKPRMLVAIALANKMARAIWAMLTMNNDYREPVGPAAV
jgi:transposase